MKAVLLQGKQSVQTDGVARACSSMVTKRTSKISAKFGARRFSGKNRGFEERAIIAQVTTQKYKLPPSPLGPNVFHDPMTSPVHTRTMAKTVTRWSHRLAVILRFGVTSYGFMVFSPSYGKRKSKVYTLWHPLGSIPAGEFHD